MFPDPPLPPARCTQHPDKIAFFAADYSVHNVYFFDVYKCPECTTDLLLDSLRNNTYTQLKIKEIFHGR